MKIPVKKYITQSKEANYIIILLLRDRTDLRPKRNYLPSEHYELVEFQAENDESAIRRAEIIAENRIRRQNGRKVFIESAGPLKEFKISKETEARCSEVKTNYKVTLAINANGENGERINYQWQQNFYAGSQEMAEFCAKNIAEYWRSGPKRREVKIVSLICNSKK